MQFGKLACQLLATAVLLISRIMESQAVWDCLSDVERTCLLVAYLRWYGSKNYRWLSGPHAGQPLYSDPYGDLWVEHCIPAEQQQLILQQSTQVKLQHLVAIRTAELDHQIAAAMHSSTAASSSNSVQGVAAHKQHQPSVQQMVILGAGTDTRAWRLQWPPGFTIYEVDSQAVLDFKRKIMVIARQQQGQALGPDSSSKLELPDLQCKRVEVVADAGQAEDLWSQLLSSGFNAARPTLFFMEGFIGYLTVAASNALLHHLHSHSAPGSRVIITAPPPPEDRARSAAAAAAKTETTEPHKDAQTGHSTTDDGDSAPPPMKLYHSTFEEPTDTLARLSAAGWSCCELLTSEQLTTKYQLGHAQPILLGIKECQGDCNTRCKEL